MLIDIEFLCIDARPLLAHKFPKEKDVIGILKPMHRHNGAVMSTTGEKSNPTFYPNIGVLEPKKSPDKKVKPALFTTRNSIKFRSFEKHEIVTGLENHKIRRGNNRIKRQFSTSNYGIVNRLHFSFQFDIKPPKGRGNRPMSEKDFSKLLDSIFTLNVTTKDCELPLWKLGVRDKLGKLEEGWMPNIISSSTKCGQHRFSKIDPNVEDCETTAVIIYAEDELPEFPKSNPFRIKDCPYNIKISWCDIDEKPIRAYFIQHDKNPDKELKEFLKGLKMRLLDLRVSYACVEQAYGKMIEIGKVHTQFVNNLDVKLKKITDSDDYQFLCLGKGGDDHKIVNSLCHKDICRMITKMLKDERQI